VSKIILQCLETDPSKRPTSALRLGKTLPGGDVLAATLAANETPSPETVAAADGGGALSTRAAWILLAITFAGFLATMLFTRNGTDVGLAPMLVGPEELSVRARDLIKNSGSIVQARDSTYWFTRDETLDTRAVYQKSKVLYRNLNKPEFDPIPKP